MGTDAPKSLVEEKFELPDKPSIAVLPFDNMSGDPGQEYFSDGLTEQIINGLCKVPDLFVIARNSSFAYRGKSVSIEQIARELGVRYILEGSVQQAGDRVRITAQLIDATTDYHMWSENYDRTITDIFILQDDITGNLISAMQIKLTLGEQALLWEGMTKNLKAFDNLMRGYQCFYRFNKNENARALHFFEKASTLDESSALNYSMLGMSHLFDMFYNWSKSPLESFMGAEKSMQQALALNDSLDMSYTALAYIHLFKKEYDRAIELAQKAVTLNPNGADALYGLATITCLAGEAEKGINIINKAFRLNPIPPSYYYHFLGIAYRMTGQFEKAITMLNPSLALVSRPSLHI